jgi:hypothetical protein
MKLETVTLTIQDKDLEFVVYGRTVYDQKDYAVLILKMIYLEMLKAIVDREALKNVLNVYQRVEDSGRVVYIKIEDNDICSQVIEKVGF